MTAERAIKEPCRVATAGNISLSGLQTIDGVALGAGDRVLVKAQTSAAANGIYVAASGAWSRATDFDATGEVVGGAVVAVTSGTEGADGLLRVAGDDEPVPGTDPIAFEPALNADSVGFAADATGAAPRNAGIKLRELGIGVRDFYLPEHGDDFSPAINRALEVAAGRDVWLPDQEEPLPCLSPIIYANSNADVFVAPDGHAPAPRLRGANRLRTVLEFDYDGDDPEDAAIQIDGSDVAYRFQQVGGLFDFAMRPKAGRRIAYGVSLRGLVYGRLEGLDISYFLSEDGASGAGIVNPYAVGLGNVDRYNITGLDVVNCDVAYCYRGVDLQTGLGAAGATFYKCRIWHNESDGVRYNSAANVSFPECALAFNGRRIVKFEADTEIGSPVLTVTSGAMPADCVKGKEIRGPGIPRNAVVHDYDPLTNEITICAVTRQNLPGTPTTALATDNQSDAEFIMVGGYGFNMEGAYLGTSGAIDLSKIEFDGNTSGAAYLKAFLSVYADAPRVISRNLDGIVRVGASSPLPELERSPVHFAIDQTYLGRRLRIRNAYHRFDVVINEQVPKGYHTPTTLYESGTGSVLNTLGMDVDIGILLKGSTFEATTVASNAVITVTDDGDCGFEIGQVVEGSGIPAGAAIVAMNGSKTELTLSAAATASATDVLLTLTVPITYGSGVFTNPAFRGRIVRDDYRPLSVEREHFYQRGQSSQGLTTSIAAVLWTPQSSFFADTAPNAATTGEVIADFTGDMRVAIDGVVTGASSGDVYTIGILKNGAAGSTFVQTVPTMGAAGSWPIRWEADVGVAPGDAVKVTVLSSAARSLSTPLRLRFEAV